MEISRQRLLGIVILLLLLVALVWWKYIHMMAP